jgi:hypothetical protein
VHEAARPFADHVEPDPLSWDRREIVAPLVHREEPVSLVSCICRSTTAKRGRVVAAAAAEEHR